MKIETIQTAIEQHLPGAIVTVEGDGRHFNAKIVYEGFSGLNLLARQRLVYQALGDAFATGALHALSIRAVTPGEIING